MTVLVGYVDGVLVTNLDRGIEGVQMLFLMGSRGRFCVFCGADLAWYLQLIWLGL